MPDWEPYKDLQKPPMSGEDIEHNERWKERRARMEEQTRLASEELMREKKRKIEIEEAILEIALSQKAILKELVLIREKLTGKPGKH